MRKNVVSSVAFCGVITAICVVLMLVSGVVQVVTIALPALAGVILMAIVIELGVKWALCTYAAVSVLSAFFVADKEAALIFILFFGYYPILKARLDLIRSRAVRWFVKLLLFNAAAIAEYWLAIHVLMVPEEEYMFGGSPILIVLLALANGVFVLYDNLLVRLAVLYCERIQKKMRPFLKGK